ncbi:MAG TPA: hypothetical protein VKB43_03620 [Gaiellaceae bacterium]|nr:hypothetical protein [Gaiellaceae bacterium]
MGLFRRRTETLNEQLLREAGLDQKDPRPVPLEPPKSTLAINGVVDGSGVGPKEWDVATMAVVQSVSGKWVEFITLPNGDVIVDRDVRNVDLTPLVDAIEEHLSPPYRAYATRQTGTLWGVGAKRIQVAQIPFPSGDTLELTRSPGNDEFNVDGEPSDEAVPPELEAVGTAIGESFYVEAGRIDGDFWEVKATVL